MNTEAVKAALGSSWTVKEWKGCRLYLTYDGRDAGYLVAGDSGVTGTCRNVKVRQGTVAEALRRAGVTVTD
jgi:hypothetical protein